VENAVKHGLRPKEGGKKLELKIARRGRDVSITISNNGIPYQKKSSTSGTGKGLEIHRQLIEIYRSLKNVEIATEIGLCANGTGTCVEIIMQNIFAGQPTHK
jgi:LytS/YehU family sensor histidine kinase